MPIELGEELHYRNEAVDLHVVLYKNCKKRVTSETFIRNFASQSQPF